MITPFPNLLYKFISTQIMPRDLKRVMWVILTSVLLVVDGIPVDLSSVVFPPLIEFQYQHDLCRGSMTHCIQTFDASVLWRPNVIQVKSIKHSLREWSRRTETHFQTECQGMSYVKRTGYVWRRSNHVELWLGIPVQFLLWRWAKISFETLLRDDVPFVQSIVLVTYTYPDPPTTRTIHFLLLSVRLV
jgi:hypothetical protein